MRMSLGAGMPGGQRGLVNLDFSQNLLPNGIAFSRTTSATYIDDNGQVLTAIAGIPRFERNCLLIESQSTNLCIQSAQLNTNWNTSGNPIVIGSALSPDGGSSGWTVSRNSPGDYIFQAISATVGVTYTATVYLLKDAVSSRVVGFAGSSAGGGYELSVRSDTGAVPYIGGNVIAAAVEAVGLWWRVQWTWISPTSSLQLRIWPAYGVSGVYDAAAIGNCVLTFCAVEARPTASSYIPSGGAPTVRLSDQASFVIPPGILMLRYQFDDDSIQNVEVAPGSYVVPVNLNRRHIRRIMSL